MTRTSAIAALLTMLSAAPAAAHHGDSSRHVIDQSIQQATLPSMQPRTLDIVNPHRLIAPPYVIPQSPTPTHERPAQRRQPCARWIDEGCR